MQILRYREEVDICDLPGKRRRYSRKTPSYIEYEGDRH
jgi:hypothetical protein